MTDHDVATTIEAWFAKYHRDGEFTCSPRNHPYSLIGTSRQVGTIIYCSKLLKYLTIDDRVVPNGIGFLQRYGLPNPDDIVWMRQLVGKRKLLFFGDLDPVDLLVFAWLRRRLHGTRLQYAGINDKMLKAVGFDLPDSVLENRTIPLIGSERRGMKVLANAFPDFAEIVGKKCAALLTRGRKLEIEAILSVEPATRDALFSALGIR